VPTLRSAAHVPPVGWAITMRQLSLPMEHSRAETFATCWQTDRAAASFTTEELARLRIDRAALAHGLYTDWPLKAAHRIRAASYQDEGEPPPCPTC